MHRYPIIILSNADLIPSPPPLSLFLSMSAIKNKFKINIYCANLIKSSTNNSSDSDSLLFFSLFFEFCCCRCRSANWRCECLCLEFAVHTGSLFGGIEKTNRRAHNLFIGAFRGKSLSNNLWQFGPPSDMATVWKMENGVADAIENDSIYFSLSFHHNVDEADNGYKNSSPKWFHRINEVTKN